MICMVKMPVPMNQVRKFGVKWIEIKVKLLTLPTLEEILAYLPKSTSKIVTCTGFLCQKMVSLRYDD